MADLKPDDEQREQLREKHSHLAGELVDVRNKVLHVEKEIKAVQKEILEAGEVRKNLMFMIFFVVLLEYKKTLSDFTWLEITVSNQTLSFEFGNKLLSNSFSRYS